MMNIFNNFTNHKNIKFSLFVLFYLLLSLNYFHFLYNPLLGSKSNHVIVNKAHYDILNEKNTLSRRFLIFEITEAISKTTKISLYKIYKNYYFIFPFVFFLLLHLFWRKYFPDELCLVGALALFTLLPPSLFYYWFHPYDWPSNLVFLLTLVMFQKNNFFFMNLFIAVGLLFRDTMGIFPVFMLLTFLVEDYYFYKNREKIKHLVLSVLNVITVMSVVTYFFPTAYKSSAIFTLRSEWILKNPTTLLNSLLNPLGQDHGMAVFVFFLMFVPLALFAWKRFPAMFKAGYFMSAIVFMHMMGIGWIEEVRNFVFVQPLLIGGWLFWLQDRLVRLNER
jgi:hypothetical protein